MFRLSFFVLASCAFLPSVSTSPWGTSYTNSTTPSPSTTSGRASGDSSCGACKVDVNGAHLLYWYNEVLTFLVETDTIHGENISRPGAKQVDRRPVNITQSLPAAGATETVLFPFSVNYEKNITDASGYIATTTASGLTLTFPTPYILYTGYEIEKGQLVTANGKVKCSTTTATSQFSQAHAVAYSGNPSVDWAGAGNGGGPIPAAFLQAEGILSCSPGTYRGLPTLEVVVGTYTDVYAVSPAHIEQSVADIGPVAATNNPVSQGPTPASPGQGQTSMAPVETKVSTAVTVQSSSEKSSTAVPLSPQSSVSRSTPPATTTVVISSSVTIIQAETTTSSAGFTVVGAATVKTSPPNTANPASSLETTSPPGSAQQPQQQPGGEPSTVQQGSELVPTSRPNQASISAQASGSPTVHFAPSPQPSAFEASSGSSQGDTGAAESTQLSHALSTGFTTFTTTSGSSTVVVTQTFVQGGPEAISSVPTSGSIGSRTIELTTFTTTSGFSTFLATETLIQNAPQATAPVIVGESSGPHITEMTTFTSSSGSSTFLVTATVTQNGAQAAPSTIAGGPVDSSNTEVTTFTSSSGSSTFLVTATVTKNGAQTAPSSITAGSLDSRITELTTFTKTSGSSTFLVTETLLQNGPQATISGFSGPGVTELTTFMTTSGSSTFLVTETLLQNGPQATISGFSGPGVTELTTFMTTSGSSTFVVTKTVIASAVGASPVATISGFAESGITELTTFTTTSGSSAFVVTETVVVSASGGIPVAILSGINGGPGSAPSETIGASGNPSATASGTIPSQFAGRAAKVTGNPFVWLASGAASVGLMASWLL